MRSPSAAGLVNTCEEFSGAESGCVIPPFLVKTMIQSAVTTRWNFKYCADVRSLISCENSFLTLGTAVSGFYLGEQPIPHTKLKIYLKGQLFSSSNV